MKLSEIELTDVQAKALMGWLNERVALEQAKERKAMQELDQEATDAVRSDRLIMIAELSARLAGPVRGVSVGHLSDAAWKSFCDHEAFFTPLNVDEYFSNVASEWEETFSIHFEHTMNELRSGKTGAIDTDAASKLWTKFTGKE